MPRRLPPMTLDLAEGAAATCMNQYATATGFGPSYRGPPVNPKACMQSKFRQASYVAQGKAALKRLEEALSLSSKVHGWMVLLISRDRRDRCVAFSACEIRFGDVRTALRGALRHRTQIFVA